jgi:hypothetical protein
MVKLIATFHKRPDLTNSSVTYPVTGNRDYVPLWRPLNQGKAERMIMLISWMLVVS